MAGKFLLVLAGAVLLLAGGCGMFKERTPKMPSEDIELFTTFGTEIRILKDRSLPRNARERFDAAMRLAEGVDFSFTRNVSTLEKIFDPADAHQLPISSTESVIVFSYYYGDKSINFNFARTHNAISRSNVVISDGSK